MITKLVLNYGSKSLECMETPAPVAGARSLLVENLYSAISCGTESMMMRLASKGLLAKARSRPDLVRKVLDKVKTDGIVETYRQSAARLAECVPLGYSSVGRVLEVGRAVGDLKAGDLVACVGQNLASHSELICIPRTMCAPVPAGVDPAQASFAGIAAVVINAIRLAKPELGSLVGVVGLGLLGQMAVRILSASGVRVFGCDPNPASRARVAAVRGVEVFPDAESMSLSIRSAASEHGADAMLLCAAQENDRSLLAAVAAGCRVGGKIIAVGVTPLVVPRKIFYERELSLTVSRSFGPGVYEREYETGSDYPYAHVRWTVARNLACFLDLLAAGHLDLADFIDTRLEFPGDRDRYADLVNGKAKSFGAVFHYGRREPKRTYPRALLSQAPRSGKLRIALIGAGDFARSTLLPELSAIPSVSLTAICSGTPEQAAVLQKRYGFERCSTQAQEIVAAGDVDAVVISNRHSAHASLTVAALGQGKHVFVEKPLALTVDELHTVAAALQTSSGSLMVGFNRRFAPDYARLREWFHSRSGPATMLYRINAGWMPPDHWIMDAREGGRFLGELCHYVDLVMDLAGSPLKQIYASAPGGAACGDMSLLLQFEEPVQATLTYSSSGHRKLGRERLEVFRGEGAAILDNYSRLEIVTGSGRKKWRHTGARRGHREELRAWAAHLLKHGCAPMGADTFLASTEANLLALQSAMSGKPITVFRYGFQFQPVGELLCTSD
jgi:predicted dehydrogenase/threonine dehydrogenase-like Zn-dependent dehydrogenase